MLRLGYTRLGNNQGTPLAIIHGWGCDSSSMKPLANMFKDRDVYLIDLPGYGKSAHLASLCDDFSSTNYLLLNTLPQGCDLISWSFGSIYALRAISTLYNPCINLNSFAKTIQANSNIKALEQHLGYSFQTSVKEHSPFMSVLQAALENPCKNKTALFTQSSTKNSSCPKDLIRSLITICGSPRFPSDPNWQGLSAIKILKCNTLLTPRRLQRILNIFYRMIVQTDNAESSNQCTAFLANRPQIPYEVLMAGIRMVTYLDERPSLSYLKVPSLHLFGRHDLLVPCALAKFFEQSFGQDSGHQSFIFEHSSHSPMYTEPELFFKVVSSFYHSLDQ